MYAHLSHYSLGIYVLRSSMSIHRYLDTSEENTDGGNRDLP